MGAAPQPMGNDLHRPEDAPSYDQFEVALSRLESGESVDEALRDCPAELYDELRSLLEISGVVLDLRHIPLPVRTVEQHRKGKNDFLAEAARFRPAAAPTTPAGFSLRALQKILQRVGDGGFGNFSVSLPQLRPQLTPVLASIAVVAMLAVNIVQVAQAAVPGDLTYPLKDWLRDVEVRMASSEQRPELIARQEIEVRQDIEKALERDAAEPQPIEVTRRLTYYGRRGQLLDVGGMIVFDSNSLTIDESAGALTPDAVVQVTFRILPGQSSYVEGVRIEVVATPTPPPPPPTEQAPPKPTVVATPVPTVASAAQSACVPLVPAGWIRYRVRAGDSLSQISVSGGTQESKVIQANCLGGQTVYIGQTLYVPGTAGLITQAEENELPRPTATTNAPATSTPAPAITPEQMPTEVVTADTPTTVGETATPGSTPDPVGGAAVTSQPATGTPVAPPTPDAGNGTATTAAATALSPTPADSTDNTATSVATPLPAETLPVGETAKPDSSGTSGAEGTATTVPATPTTVDNNANPSATTVTPADGTPVEPATSTAPKNETPTIDGAPASSDASTSAPSPPTPETSNSPPATAEKPAAVTQEPNPAPPSADTPSDSVATAAPVTPAQPAAQPDAGATGGTTENSQSEAGASAGSGKPVQPAPSEKAPPEPAAPAPPAPIPADPTSTGP